MMLACEDDDPFFVQNGIYQEPQPICYLARVNVYMISLFVPVTFSNPHIFAKRNDCFKIPRSQTSQSVKRFNLWWTVKLFVYIL